MHGIQTALQGNPTLNMSRPEIPIKMHINRQRQYEDTGQRPIMNIINTGLTRLVKEIKMSAHVNPLRFKSTAHYLRMDNGGRCEFSSRSPAGVHMACSAGFSIPWAPLIKGREPFFPHLTFEPLPLETETNGHRRKPTCQQHHPNKTFHVQLTAGKKKQQEYRDYTHIRKKNRRRRKKGIQEYHSSV